MDGRWRPATRRLRRTGRGRPRTATPTPTPTWVAAAVTVVLAVAATGCWPAPGQGPDRSAHNPFETVITPRTVRSLAPVWTATVDTGTSGGVVGPPVVSNVGVHVSDTAALYTFDAATGATLWQYPETATIAGAVGDPLADGDRVLFTSGLLVGFGGAWHTQTAWLDARTGAYQADVPSSRVTSRRGSWVASYSMAGGTAVGVYLFLLQVQDLDDPGSGWSNIVRFATSPANAPPATLGRERLYYAGPATEAYDPPVNVTGVRAFPLTPPAACDVPPEGVPLGPLPCPLWATPTPGTPVTSPVLAPDESVLYVGTDDGTLLALDAADGHVRWSVALGAAPSADPAVAEGWVYVTLDDGDLVALPAGGCGGAATCEVAWRADVGGAGVQPAVAGGLVFVGTDAGHVVALRASGCRRPTCRPLWRHDFGAPVTGAPAVSNGRLYVGVSPDRVEALAPRPSHP